MKKKQNKKLSVFTIAAIAGATLLTTATLLSSSFTNAGANASIETERLSYIEYEKLLNEGKIDQVIYNENDEYMTVILFNDQTQNMTETERENQTHNISEFKKVIYPDNEEFKINLLEHGVIVKRESGFASSLSRHADLIFYIILIGGMLVFMRKASPLASTEFVHPISPKEIDVDFDDVIGHEEIKGDLKLLVKQLKSGTKAKDLSHGVLFEGEAGTGKTMLAKAIAHEAGVNFISVNSSNLVEMYVGLGAKRVRDTFRQARQSSPCVLFFDEIDAVGAKRGSQRSHRENDQTINALLTELDGFEDKGDILVIAATNRADDLDDALLRSGRFDRKIKVEAPQKWETRKELFDHYIENRGDESVQTETLAKQTVGFSGADIASVCREARLIAFREDNDKITQAYLEEAIDKMVFKGSRSNAETRKEDLEIVAYHEAGHAVMTYLTHHEISRISVMGMTSGVGGAVFQADSDSAFKSKQRIEEDIMIAYAGRASEEVFFGKEKVTQGAGNDITQATKLLLAYTSKLGFDDKTGLIDTEVLTNSTIFDNKIQDRISELSNEFYKKTTVAIRTKQHLVDALAQKLIEVKTLSGKEATQLLIGLDI